MDYGKFNSAEELLKGYTALEKSFTQKCQQLAELQKQQGTSETPQTELSSPMQGGEIAASIPEAQPSSGNLNPTNEQLQQFLEQNPDFAYKLLQSQTPPPTAPTVITGGGSMSLALPSKPKTIKEATLMAQKLFENV